MNQSINQPIRLQICGHDANLRQWKDIQGQLIFLCFLLLSNNPVAWADDGFIKNLLLKIWNHNDTKKYKYVECLHAVRNITIDKSIFSS